MNEMYAEFLHIPKRQYWNTPDKTSLHEVAALPIPNVFITGVSSGLGLELLRLYLAGGSAVFGVSRYCTPELVELADRHGASFRWAACDVAAEEDVARVKPDICRNRFMPDIVILNAGIHAQDAAPFLMKTCDSIFSVNSRGALIWVEHFLPLFLELKRGHFAYISSLAALFPFPFRGSYSASKAFVSTMFGCLRKQHASDGIQFTTFYAGLLDTSISRHAAVPGFMKYPTEKAARAVARAIDGKRSAVLFPMRAVALEMLLALMPNRMLVRKMTKPQPGPSRN